MSYIGANAQGLISNIDGGTISNATLDSTVTFPAGKNYVAAFVVFDGGSDTGNNAAQTINSGSSYNVSSVTRSGTLTGKFIINFSVTFENANYILVGSSDANAQNNPIVLYDSSVSTKSTTSVGVRVMSSSLTSLRNASDTAVLIISTGLS